MTDKYRLETRLEDKWVYHGTYSSAEKAWREAEAYMERGRTRIWRNFDYRIFKMDAQGGYGAQTRVQFRGSEYEAGIVIAQLTNGTKLGAWLE